MALAPRIDRYLARLIFMPLLGTLLLAAMLLTLEKMLRLFDFVVSEGGPVTVVWRMMANLIPEYLGLGIPIGLMLGVLFAFRRLAISSELDSLRAVGLGYGRLLRVPYLYAIVLMLANVAIVGFVQPFAQYNYQELRFDLQSGALGASIKVGEFTNFGRRMTLRVERSERRGTDLYGVFVRASTRDGRTLAVTADRGTFMSTDDPNTIIFRLQNGRLVHNQRGFPTPRVLTFQRYDLPIDLPAIAAFRGRGNPLNELTIIELFRQGYQADLPPDRRAAAQANFHFRMVEMLMILMLPLLAVALAVPPKRSTSGLGIFLSIVMVVTYHKVNQYAEEAGATGRLEPVIALWVPFLIFAGLIFWMYWTLAHKPGGQPIGALERAFAKLGKWIGRIFRRRRRQAIVPAE
ncbi:MAG: LPS export ABC transporter permease LptF [Sphingomonas sp.]